MEVDHQGIKYHQTSYPAKEGSTSSFLPITNSDELPLAISGKLQEGVPNLQSESNLLG
jgi:hypothetical protein